VDILSAEASAAAITRVISACLSTGVDCSLGDLRRPLLSVILTTGEFSIVKATACLDTNDGATMSSCGGDDLVLTGDVRLQ
jgi:hypothetical protein